MRAVTAKNARRVGRGVGADDFDAIPARLEGVEDVLADETADAGDK
jgi:hypothetical protein